MSIIIDHSFFYRFFTHYDDRSDDYGCFAYVNCPEFSDEGCGGGGCVSGEVKCPVESSVNNSIAK